MPNRGPAVAHGWLARVPLETHQSLALVLMAPLQFPSLVCLSCQCPAYTEALGSATGMDALAPGQQKGKRSCPRLRTPSYFEQAGL